MKKYIDNFLTRLERTIENYNIKDKNIKWFRQCVYLLLLVKMLFIWPELGMFYNHAINIGTGSSMPYRLFFNSQLYHYYNIYWLIAVAIVAIATFSKARLWLSIPVFLISLNYILLGDKSSNGGDSLHNFLVFMLIFIRDGSIKYSTRKMVTNAAILIIQVHFCILYFVNAYGKIIHPFWRDGSYFKNLWQLYYYANPHLIPHWFFNPALNLFTAWAVIVFEFLFPVLIWFKPFKKPLIYLGLLFHVAIAILLSLPDFGITMVIVYILFYNFKTSCKDVTTSVIYNDAKTNASL